MDAGSNIGQYRIIRKIGAGGMGSVFLGEHILLARRAAIKTLLPALSRQAEIVERFFNEARATSAISDPGVVQVFDFGYHVDGTAYIVMELIEGEALSARLDRLGRLPIDIALRIARQVAGSLAVAHGHNIVHRDLKPENIFMIRDAETPSGERTKILDFGICKLGIDTTLTQSGASLGTPVYMSPEQCRGSGRVDHRADIYALGCLLFHMLTGRPPFEREGAGELIVAHMQEDARAPSAYANIPEIVDELVAQCLEKSPDKRFQSMEALQHAIDQVLAEIDVPSEELGDVRPAIPLGAGWQSSFDASKRAAMPSDLWFQSTATPTPTTLGSANGQAEPEPARRSQRPLLAILLFGVVAGAVAFGVSLAGDDSDDVRPASVSMPSVYVPPPSTPVAVEPAPTPPASPVPTPPTPEPPTPVPPTVEPAPVESALAIAAPVKPAPIVAPAPISKPKTVVRRAASRRDRPSVKPPTEDLYDTR